MVRDRNIKLEEMTGASRDIEEQVGLLKASKEDGWDSSEICEDEEPRCKEDRDFQEPVQHTIPRQSWIRLSAIAILVLCTLGVLAHFVSSSRRHGPVFPTSPARLRPEEDYILDAAWQFDAPPVTREYTWIIEDHQLNPDGVYRPMILINDTFPGPLIECNEGDELVIHVHNRASNATSIHWHGLYQNGTNHMDGTVGVTQCPIAPGGTFTYRFNVTGQSGSYWYHSHVSMQASDGLVGPLIIYARGGREKDEVSYDQDRVLLLSDHYYDLSSKYLMRYLSPGSENDEPVPPSALINGRSIRNCSDLPDRNCSTSDLTNALFDLSANKSTRLRIINVGAFAEFSLQIDEHEFHVTEVDGTDVFPQAIHRLNINPAQRYSIVLTPPKAGNKNLYWLRARMITHCFAYEEPELQEEVRAVIRYGHEQESPQKLIPQSKDWPEIIEIECRDLNTSSLEPVIPIAAPATADHLVYFRSSFQIRDWRLSRGYLNDSSFHMNATSPILHTLVDFTTDSSPIANGINTALFDPSTQLIYQTTGTPTIDILIQNLDDGNHPFHLHGYKFWVLAQGHGYPPADLHQNLNLTNPLRRDTASVEAFGWTLLRFVADNAGVWAFHCHIAWHSEAGLAMVFATRADEIATWKVPKEMRTSCAAEGIERGMGPSDEMWVGTFE
jgi:FtsP/CotA-like multicopper oxidase with cupredoxin domain